MANKDFYDRIADALEILAGDDAHVDDDYPTMDYYSRIADALEAIADSGISGGGEGGSCNCQKLIVTIVWDDNEDNYSLDKTWQQIYDVFSTGGQVIILGSLEEAYSGIAENVIRMDFNSYSINTFNTKYLTSSASDYPIMEQST